ncbi:MBL fold metallo-hydrolase [Propioniciclava coleopterorum]|uniref:MBL fold metallo-hydrolase n=1 Tax=Propioniciclava coleopterorum TaxID=2714937 RepID=A0A6G7Y3B2_9ACTN|nr:ComEC/Rec2 family competence protein [Propioniciclava coleopterorum]QIK71097.1 MBL fold metallo-hydrolase [Propioniciclava coleopterorum]
MAPDDRPDTSSQNPGVWPWALPVLAGVTWAATAAAVGGEAGWLIGIGLAAGVAGMLAWRRRSALLGAAAVLAAVCVATGAVQAVAVRDGPLGELARQGATAVVEVQVGAGRLWPAAGNRDGLWRATGTLMSADARGGRWAGRTPVELVVTGALAPAWASLPLGSLVRAQARLAEPDAGQAAWLVVRARGAPTIVGGPGVPWNAVGALRAGLREACATLPGDARHLVPALVVGDTSGFPEDLRQRFVTTGLTHLTAVSGANLTLMLGFLRALVVGLGLRGRVISVVMVAGVAGFVLLCLGEPSVLRAAAMGLVGLAALGHGGSRGSGLRALSVAVLVVVLVEPAMARSLGFGLSVTATAGLLLWARPFAAALGRWLPRWVAEALAVPLAAQLATEPLVVALAGQVSVVAVVANLLAGPLVGPATVVGLGVTLVAPVWLAGARLLAWPAGLCAEGIAWIARIGDGLPGAAIPWRADVWGQSVVALACLLLVVVLPSVLARPLVCLVIAAGLGAVLLRVPPTPGWPDPAWRVASCDVGQGDATVIRAGPGAGVVVDTGPEPRLLRRCLDQLGVRSVPVLVLTHLHADHAGGAAALGDRTVGMVVTSTVRTPASADRMLDATFRGTPRVFVTGGESWRVGEIVVGVVAAPRVADTTVQNDGESSAENDASLLLRIEAPGLSLMLAGDAEDAAQAAHARLGALVDADVMLVPHHGSGRHAASFFAAVSPTVALVSVGAGNDYGHPSARTVRDVEATGARVFRTDLHGGITVARSPDGSLRVTPQR